MIVDNGLNKVATLLSTNIVRSKWGQGSALPTPSDTGLAIPINASSATLTSTLSGNSVQFTANISSTTANTTGFSEYVLIFSSGTTFTRSIGAPFTKTSSYEVTTISTINCIRSNT
jgi:hypothetical protein